MYICGCVGMYTYACTIEYPVNVLYLVNDPLYTPLNPDPSPPLHLRLWAQIVYKM